MKLKLFLISLFSCLLLMAQCINDLNGRGTPSGRAPARIDTTWSTYAGAVAYNVRRSSVSGGPYVLLGVTTSPAFSDTNGLVNGATYYYVVEPLDIMANVICQSNQATITIPAGH